MACATLLVACSGNNEKNNNGESNATDISQDIKETEDNESSEAGSSTESNTKEETTAATKPSTKNDGTKTTKPTTANTKPSQTTTATEAPKVKTCTITVDGYCSNKTIEIKEGDTVYDILKKTGANVSARTTGYGLYVEGINGRFEFDEGPTSGWVYTVNGSRISKSCDKCVVNAGDKIVWTYVTEL